MKYPNPMKLDPIVRGYLETALWSSSDITPNGEHFTFDDYGIIDIAEYSVDQAIADCRQFELFAEAVDISLSQFDYERIGHDFWLTRNGHGAGFWDGDYAEEIGIALTELCKKFRELHPTLGDDGLIYFE